MNDIPKERTFNINEPYFSYIFNGIKTYEGRRGNSRFVITTTCSDLLKIVDPQSLKWFVVIRGEACIHNSVKSMLICNKHPNMLPCITNMNDQLKEYERFGLTESVAKEYGAHAIKLTIYNPLYIEYSLLNE